MKISLPWFILLTVGVGWAIGYFNIPGEWYAQLVKPSFNPPNWVFGPVWTMLYVLIAIAGWRTWKLEGSSKAFKFWLLQMTLNFAWSPVFFSLQRLDVALLIIGLMLFAIMAFVIDRWWRDRVSAWLFVPYAAWVMFAGLLNLMLLRLN